MARRLLCVFLLLHDDTVGAGEDEALVAVRIPDEIGRRAVRATHLDDLGKLVRVSNDATVDVEPVAYCRLHRHSLPTHTRVGPDRPRNSSLLG